MPKSKMRVIVQVGSNIMVWDENSGYSKREMRLAVGAIAAMMSGLKTHSHIGEPGWDK